MNNLSISNNEVLTMSGEMINLMQGDCLERMKEIPDGSVDMILTVCYY